MRILRYILLAFGVIGVLISLPLLGFAALGFLGILADVGPIENRELGIQLLIFGLPTFIGGVMLCAFGLRANTSRHRRADAEIE